MTLLLRPQEAGLAAPPLSGAAVREHAVSAVHPLVRAALYLFVVSIPFELPKSALPLEVPTLTGLVLMIVSVLDLRACYSRIPAAVLLFQAQFWFLAVMGAVTSMHRNEMLKYLCILLQGLLLFWMLANLLRDERTLVGVLWAVVLSTTARAIVQISGIAATHRSVWTGGDRVSAFGQNANLSAIILSVGLATTVGLVVTQNKRLPRLGLIAVPIAVVLSIALIQTGSRGGLICAGLAMVAYLFSGRTIAARIRNGALGLLAVGGLIWGATHSTMMRNRVTQAAEEHNLAGRERIYPAALAMIREKPLTGWGPLENQYEIADRIRERAKLKRDAHNLLLEVLTSTGIVGAVPFLIALALCVRGAWAARRGPLGMIPLGVLLAMLGGTLGGTWIASKVLWFTLALALAAGLWWRPTPLEERWSRCAV